MLRFYRIAVLLLATGLFLPACEQEDPTSAEYWVERLKTAQRKEAIRQLGDMKGNQVAFDALVGAYKSGRDKYPVVATLAQMGDKKAVPVMLEALQDSTEKNTAKLAATTLLEWEVADQSDIYIKVAANKSASKEQRYGAMQLLAKYPVQNAKPMLLTLLKSDPDLLPIVFNGLAAEALGKLKVAEAVDDLIYCMWLDDAKGRSVVPQCRLALNRIGSAAVQPKLLETLARKNRRVEKLARKHKFHIGGLIEAKCAELAGDMPSTDATEPLLAALTKEETAPPSVMQDPNKANAFIMGSVQKAISVANALAVIGDERAVEPLVALAGSKDKALEYKLSAVQQLAFLGSPKAIAPLLKLFQDEPHRYDPVSQGFRVQLALAAANLMDGNDAKGMAKFEKSIDGVLKTIEEWRVEVTPQYAEAKGRKKKNKAAELRAYKEWTTNYTEVKAKLAALRECKVDPACWGKKLDDKNVGVKMLAGYRLAQTKEAKDTAVKQLITHVGEKDLAVRNVILFGLDRLGDASLIPELEKALVVAVADAAKDKRLKGGVYTLELMIAKLSHKKKG
jgi:HEAT repeat protein